MEESENLIRNVGKVSFFILLSRITGLMREMAVAIFMGANYVTDALFVGWAVPNVLRRFLAEGLVAPAFIPAFRKAREDGRIKEAISSAIGQISVVTGIISIFLVVFSEEIVGVLAPGFGPEAKRLSAFFTASLSPYILFISTATVLSAFLNTFHVFGVPASTMFIFNSVNIASIVLFYYFFGRPEVGFIFGVFLGVFVQNIMNLMSSMKIDRFGFSLRNNEYSRIIWSAIPAVIVGGAIYQLNFLISRAIASFGGEKTVSYITYASRFFEFPLGVLVYSVSYVALPFLAGRDGVRSFSASVYVTTVMIIPATIGLFVLSEPIIQMVFGYGRFTRGDVVGTAEALSMYSLGLLAVAISRIFVSDFQANRRLHVPVVAGFLSLISNALLCFIFVWSGMRHEGVALASSISALVGLIPLALSSDKRGVFLIEFLRGIKTTAFPSGVTFLVCLVYVHAWRNVELSHLVAFALLIVVVIFCAFFTLLVFGFLRRRIRM